MKPVPLCLMIALLVGSVTACATGPASFDPERGPWISAREQDHPLVGRIWQPAEERFATADQVLEAMAGASYVIIGETHDNPDHHRLQAWLVGKLFARGRSPAVAFEMFTTDQDAALQSYLAAHPRDAAGIARAVGWNERGWPDWNQYAPIAQAALDAGAPILAAGLDQLTIRMVAKEGVSALGPDSVVRLGLKRPLPKDLFALMRTEIIDGHCDQLPESMIDPMTTVQLTRDAHMAGAMLRGATLPRRDGAVLIAGKGHARTDYAVPFHLRRLVPDKRVVSIAAVEVAPGETDPKAYAARFNAEVLPFDFVWFTPYPDRKDPCEAFADQLRKAKERHLKERKPN